MPVISNLTTEKLLSELEGDSYYVADNDVGGPAEETVKVPVSSIILMANKTVNFDNSMTATEIQTLIDAQPKNLNGYDLTFQSADGTYAMDAGIVLTGFYGGRVFYLGNSSDNSLAGTKSVHYNFSTASAGVLGISCKANAASMYVWYIQTTTPGGGNEIGVNMEQNLVSDVRYCASAAASNSNTRCMNFIYTKAFTYNNYIGLSQWGIYAGSTAEVVSHTNDDGGGGAQPVYGLYASSGLIMKQTATTQPTGSTSDEDSVNGGVIR